MQQAYSDQGSFSNLLKSTVETGFDNQQLYSDYWLEDGSFSSASTTSPSATRSPDSGTAAARSVSPSACRTCAHSPKYSGVDPELYSGLDRDVYPRPRTYTLGLKLLF